MCVSIALIFQHLYLCVTYITSDQKFTLMIGYRQSGLIGMVKPAVC
jgi:hypothetical protein